MPSAGGTARSSTWSPRPAATPSRPCRSRKATNRYTHARATGKLLLAHATPEVREDYFATHAMERRTAKTLVDRDSLVAELSRISEDGFSIDREEFALGLCCLAVPVGRSGVGATFAIGISAPAERFDAEFDRYLSTLRRIGQAA